LIPKWLYGWRDVTDMNANIRTLISSIYPISASGNTIFNLFTDRKPDELACLVAQHSSLVCDYVARAKIAGTHFLFPFMDQIPCLPPSAFGRLEKEFIVPRVLRLVFTSYSLKGFYHDILKCSVKYDNRPESQHGTPFPFDLDARAIDRAELDAFVAYMWGVSRRELQYILNPADVVGSSYPTETFRGLREAEIKEFGEYRTQRLVLEAWDRIVEPLRRGQA
jgi:hypothetical protein